MEGRRSYGRSSILNTAEEEYSMGNYMKDAICIYNKNAGWSDETFLFQTESMKKKMEN